MSLPWEKLVVVEMRFVNKNIFLAIVSQAKV